MENIEWNFFLGQSFTTNRPDTSKASENLPSWIPDHVITNVASLQSVLPNLYNSLQLDNKASWKNFMEKSDCENNFPAHCQLTEFQKMLVVQALRGDRLHSALLQCVLHLTGLRSLNPEILQLSSVFKETFASEPILLLSAPGTDPSSEIKDLAHNKVGDDKYTEIAMGEGQESTALSALNESGKLEHWLILKNLHLVTSWLPILCQHLQSLQPHKNFRLWLITEPHTLFSPVLAQNSLKIAYEVPHGVKNNLLRTYSSWGSPYIEKLNPTGSRMFFVLACVHALLQERRTYIPQGWSKAYEFSDIDLSTTVQLAMELWRSQNMNVQWKFLIGLCLDAIYGGRIENIQDLAVLESYLRQYFIDEVLSHRWRPLGFTLSLPSYSNFEEYVNVIRQLSDRDLPSYFGLPENIDRAWEKNMASDIISHLRGLSIIKNKTEKFVREEWQKKLSPFMSLWKKLNQGHDYIRMATPTAVSNDSSIATFIFEEYCAAILLVQQIHKCFAVLNKITKGSIIAEDKDLQLANDLQRHYTPKAWQNLWNGPKDPSKYLKSVILKTINISKWKNEPVEIILKQPVNLSFLLHPQTFLTAFKQEFSRKNGVAMDELILKSSWKPAEGDSTITLTGLLVEGALFDGYSLSPCLASSDSITAAPDCYISWVKKQNLMESGKVIEVPLYYSSTREEILTHLLVASNFKEKDKWIQAGLSFFIAY